MPQVTCPNCGMTINLKNRKKIDFGMIIDNIRRRPKTFTELLKTTRLPRKTLSLRLKELRESGVLVKEHGVYKLNGSLCFKDGESLTKKFSRVFHNDRIRTVTMLTVLLVCSLVSGHVLARFFTPLRLHQENQQQQPIGSFSMDIYVMNVADLYAWQVAIIYNSSQLEVLDIIPGNFVGEEFPYFVNSTDTVKGLLLLGGTLVGEVPGKSGSGKLATVVFGYFTEEYEQPKISLNEMPFYNTMLLDSNGHLLEIDNNTLFLIIR